MAVSNRQDASVINSKDANTNLDASGSSQADALRLKVEDLFHHERFANDWRLLFFILYVPLGIVLSVFRVFLFLHISVISVIIPKSLHTIRSIILRFLSAPLGVVISVDGRENIEKSCGVIVSNKVTILDRLIVNLVIPNVTVTNTHTNSVLCWLFGLEYVDNKLNKLTYLNTLKRIAQSKPYSIFIQPEAAQTSGNVGMLKFATSPAFILDLPIQPVIIQVFRPPIGYVTCSTIDSYYWSDMFWSLFAPTTHYSLKILPVISRCKAKGSDAELEVGEEEEQEDRAFVDEVQKMMCRESSASLIPTQYDMEDVKKYLEDRRQQRRLAEQQQQQQQQAARGMSRSSASNPQLVHMVTQVKEVLPTVPDDVVYADLARTKSINATITRLLDGTVQYTPMEPVQANLSSTSVSTSATPSTSVLSDSDIELSLSASSSAGAVPVKKPTTFSSKPEERSRTFSDRKQVMISEARRRYVAKHGKYWLPHAS